MSRVLRVARSKVRMPRSQRTTCELPELTMYSAAREELLDRRHEAALEEDGLADAAERLEELGVVHVAGADLQHVGVGGDRLEARDVEDLRDRG
jgi:hypothetical protein